ncbi:IPTL-CTERM sorting domain-containing protein [Ottowia thiooxydans]|uniref:IPTL-CTERM protein sorting domain-containing protein n=1 Tax=Ottowia thiooxydans TaxID=219182 RepID=A0ABV2Q5A7_9BURK
MLRWFVMLCAAVSTFGAQAATYLYQSGPASYVSNSVTCASPHHCGQYTIGQQVVTGTFTTATPLAPNLVDANIIPNLTSYSFNGGLFVIDSGSQASRVNSFRVTTNASGAITSAFVELHRWTYSAASSPPQGPHVDGDRRNQIVLFPSGGAFSAINLFCLGNAIGTSADGTSDTCLASGGDEFGSSGISASGALFTTSAPISVNAVPTLSEWALIILALACAALGWRRMQSVSPDTPRPS